MRMAPVTLMIAAAATLGLVGCGDDDDDGGAAGTIDATLKDFEIELSDSSVSAGEVTFEVKNEGPSVHEFVVFETDLKPDKLPTDDNGDVAEGDDLEPVDGIEDIEPDATPSLTVDLAAGHYVVACNVPGHYRQGMHTEFTAT